MSKFDEFVNEEKSHYGKIFVDINYAIDNVSPFLDNEILNRRKYMPKIDTLKKYIELIESAQSEIKHSGFFNKFKGDKYISLLKTYKSDNLESLNQLEKCSTCQCLNCTSDCKFDSCLGCKSDSNIIHCDKVTINITKHDNFNLQLTNNKTGENSNYTVIATLQNAQLNKKYIIIQDIITKEKFILYYYPGISEDNYGEITNEDEFDFIVSTFQSVDN
ncbi:hypothetical protein J2Z42_000964 [Clostridium algifaecis]|uniref:DUF1292 domain-containing protein n=1 Tax=Clostridium algifaecis TaxID=1472040 RepID=A0ABS4KQI9_9CLOT|nr:DUF1292 domain-containing protein [Clostridium algifaecis]MBP2032299.1 hypothetical protein [Clostridium algifaecis]